MSVPQNTTLRPGYRFARIASLLFVLFSPLFCTLSNALAAHVLVTSPPPTPTPAPALSLSASFSSASSPSPSPTPAAARRQAEDHQLSTAAWTSTITVPTQLNEPVREERDIHVALRLWSLQAAAVYINAIKVGSIDTDNGGDLLLSHPLASGDVIAIRTVTKTPTDGGISLSLNPGGGEWLVINPPFIRAKELTSQQAFERHWMFPLFNACAWKQATSIPVTDSSLRHALDMRRQLDGDDTMARCNIYPAHVAQSRDKVEQQLNLGVPTRFTCYRVMVSGEKCPNSPPCARGQKCPWAHKRWYTEPTQKETTDGKDRCICRQIPSPSERESSDSDTKTIAERDNCFSITGQMARWKGTLRPLCKKRSCLPKYECVSARTTHTTWCMFKYATHRTKILGKRYGNQYLCENEKLSHTTLYLVPYDQ